MLINKLKTKCSFKDCSWTGDLLDLVKDHRSQCKYATIKCSRNGCGESFLKEEMEKHDNICLYKYLQCCYCQNDVFRINKNKEIINSSSANAFKFITSSSQRMYGNH